MFKNLFFFYFFSNEHFLQPPQKGVYNEVFTTKETCPIYTLNIVYCFTGFIGIIRIILNMYVSMYFKIMSKVVKYTCGLRDIHVIIHMIS